MELNTLTLQQLSTIVLYYTLTRLKKAVFCKNMMIKKLKNK